MMAQLPSAITIPIAAMGNGGAAGAAGGGASAMLNSIRPPNARVARLPATAIQPLARIPIHFLAMIDDQCTRLPARGPGVNRAAYAGFSRPIMLC